MVLDIKTYFLAVFLGFVLVSPLSVQASSADDTYRAYLLQIIALLQEQIQALQLELADRETEAGALSSQVTMVSRYALADLAAVTDIPDQAERAYFLRVAELVPVEYRGRFAQVGVYRGTTAFDAFVETIPPQHETWLYATHEDMLSEPEAVWNTELIVHELGHVVSLDPVPKLHAVQYYACVGFQAVPVCPPEDSFLGQFINTFWSDGQIQAVTQAHKTDRLTAYYQAHDDAFVSEYAVTAPEEDFAESFMFYVLGKQPVGVRAKEKIAFFSTEDTFSKIRGHVQQVK